MLVIKKEMLGGTFPNNKMFPSGKVIIITRDPRDIICSFKKTTIAKKNDYLIALFNFVDLVNYYSRFNKKIKKNIFLKNFQT